MAFCRKLVYVSKSQVIVVSVRLKMPLYREPFFFNIKCHKVTRNKGQCLALAAAKILFLGGLALVLCDKINEAVSRGASN